MGTWTEAFYTPLTTSNNIPKNQILCSGGVLFLWPLVVMVNMYVSEGRISHKCFSILNTQTGWGSHTRTKTHQMLTLTTCTAFLTVATNICLQDLREKNNVLWG